MDPLRFTSRIRFWKPELARGLAVLDVPPEAVIALGGLRQQRVHGTIGRVEFTSNVMPAGEGRLALSVSKAMLSAAGLAVGDGADIVITRTGRD